MSSWFSCFGKKSRRKKTEKEPKNRKAKHNKKIDGDSVNKEPEKLSEASALLEKGIETPRPTVETAQDTNVKDIEIEEESTNPLLQELQTKLLERREKQNNDAKDDTDQGQQENITRESTKAPVLERNSTSTNVIVTTLNSCPTVVKAHETPSKLDLISTELDSVNAELKRTQKENEVLRQSIEKESQNAQDLYNDLNQRHNDLRGKSESLQNEIKELTECNKDLKETERKLKEENEEQRSKHEREHAKLLDGIRDRESILTDFDGLSKLCCDLALRLESLETKTCVNHNNNTEFNSVARLTELGAEHENLNQKTKGLLKNIQEIECRVIRLEVSKDSLESVESNSVQELTELLRKAETTNKNLQVDNQSMANKLAEMSYLMETLKDEKDSASRHVVWLTSEMESCKQKLSDLQDSVAKKESEIESLLRSNTKSEEELKLQSIRYQTLVSQLREKDEEYRRMARNLMESQKKRQEESETRIGKEIPAIACNGDKAPEILQDKTNAPVLISGRFRSELYLSVWKDAYSKLTDVCRRDEKKSLQILMDFCTEAYLHCRRTARQQIDTVCSLLANPSSAHSRGSISRRSIAGRQELIEIIPESLRKQILDFRKSPSKDFMDNLYEDFLSQLDFQKSRHLRSFHMKEMNEITPYIIKCLEISWEMVVQDPPMYLQFKVRHGTEIDRDKFECYSHKGRIVDYLVWPALLREENGLILQKGVVQAVATERT